MFIDTKEYQLLSKKYPHIAKNIMLKWGGYEMNTYFSDLFLGIRSGARNGFPEETATAIKVLSEKHRKEFPRFINIEKK